MLIVTIYLLSTSVFYCAHICNRGNDCLRVPEILKDAYVPREKNAPHTHTHTLELVGGLNCTTLPSLTFSQDASHILREHVKQRNENKSKENELKRTDMMH